MSLNPQIITPATPAPLGASRCIDFHWPATFGTDGTFTKRDGTNSGVNVQNALDGDAAWDVPNVGGSGVTRMHTTTGGAKVYESATVRSWFTERPPGKVTTHRNCWDIGMVCAFATPTAAVNGDVGVVLGAGTNQDVNGTGATTNPGVIFGPTDAGVVRFRARRVGGLGYVVNDTVAAEFLPADFTVFHDWRIRVVTGDPDADPYAVGMIDEKEVTERYPWTAAAAKLPAPDAAAPNNVGYKCVWACRGQGAILTWGIVECYMRSAETAVTLV